MRLFVALVPPAAALAELDAATAPLRPGRPDLRWTGPDDWHLTLAFLGEVDPGRLAGLSARLERAAGRHAALDLSIRGAGAFPGPGRARLLWAGIDGDHIALGRLAASVGAGARRAGAPPPDEGRRYRAHLTLARCRERADVRPLVEALAGFAGSTWNASQVELIRSNPGRQPRYEATGSWPLRAAGPTGSAQIWTSITSDAPGTSPTDRAPGPM